MTKISSTDVLICGAGAAGLTLAIDLARRGVSFVLIEKMAEPFGGSRGKGIQPRTQEVFEDLGIIDRPAAVGAPYPPQRTYQADGSTMDTVVMANRRATAAEPYGSPLMVPQFMTERVMRERLRELGHAPQFGCELTGFAQEETGVTATLAGGQTLRARYLVGTDGGRSFVRHGLGIGFPGKTLGVRALVADVAVDGLTRDAWHIFNEGSMETQISLCPLPNTGMFQLQAPVPLEGEVDLSAGSLAALIAGRTGRVDMIVREVSWASAFTMSARLADRYRIGRVFLAGDAAHTHPPTGGQGLNTSVQDAYNLGWKLAAVLDGADDALLDTYEAERRPVATEMLGLATRLLDAAKTGPMRRGRETHQLDLAYIDSPLTKGGPPRDGGIMSGSRAPDAPLRDAAGQLVRVFDLIKGPQWTLFAYQAERGSMTEPRDRLQIHAIGFGGDFADPKGHFRDAYGLKPGDWVLVRPDGYVGAIVSSGYANDLESYLNRVGLELSVADRPAAAAPIPSHEPDVLVIMGSTRAGRLCPKLASWVSSIGQSSTSLSYKLVDLADWPLPPDDEPDIPALGIYAQEHTKAWSRKIAQAKGFVIVTPQYNWGYPAVLKNALDHLYDEWAGKPLLIVSYGGHGGDKCAAQLKQVAEAMKMRPVTTMPAITLTRAMIGGGPVSPEQNFQAHADDIRRAFGELAECMGDAVRT